VTGTVGENARGAADLGGYGNTMLDYWPRADQEIMWLAG
jgi:hypothetical protein